jgi:hypothetical protein
MTARHHIVQQLHWVIAAAVYEQDPGRDVDNLEAGSAAD